MTLYICSEGGCEMEIEARNRRQAAERYLDGGDWGDRMETQWIDVRVSPASRPNDVQNFTVALDPIRPKCTAGHAHKWAAPYALVGGLKENPGVYGHGGGVIVREVCVYCAAYRVTDTWAQRRDTGEEGLTSIRYQEPDEESLDWVSRQAEQGD